MVLHPRTKLLMQCLRSTGVEIQVVLHHKIVTDAQNNGSTGVEIQVVLHRNENKNDQRIDLQE